LLQCHLYRIAYLYRSAAGIAVRLRAEPVLCPQVRGSICRLLITTVMVAAKFADDFFYKNEYYAKIGGISKMDINTLELELLNQLNYHLFVTERELMVYVDRLEAYRDANQELESK
jgi:hypothetical protein